MFALAQGRARLAGTGTTLAANSGTTKLRATGGQLAVDAYQAVNGVSRGYGELLAPLDVRLGAVQGSAAASGTLVHAYSQAGTTSLRAGLHSTSQAKGSDSTHIAADSSSAFGTSSVYLIAGRTAQIDDPRAGHEKPILVVQFKDLVGRAPAIAVLLGALHIGIVQLAFQP